MRKFALTTFLFTLSNLLLASSYGTIVSKNGVNVRKAAILESEIVCKLAMGEDVTIINDSLPETYIPINGAPTKGKFLEIKTKLGFSGYVFDHFVLPKRLAPKNSYTWCEEERPCDSEIVFRDFSVFVSNWQTDEYREVSGDTLTISEYVFNSISDKYFILNHTAKDVKVTFSMNQTIVEQYDYRKVKDNWYEWNKQRVRWQGPSKEEIVVNKGNYYRVPSFKTEYLEECKQKLNLRDTFIDLSGESYNVATLVYKEKPCVYHIDYMVLTFEWTNEQGMLKRKYLKVYYSYGC